MEDRLKKWYEKYKPKFSFLELKKLYEYFVRLAYEHGIDPQAFDFEQDVIDWSLDYYENKRRIEEIFGVFEAEEKLEKYKEELKERGEEKYKEILRRINRVESEIKSLKEGLRKLNIESIIALRDEIRNLIRFIEEIFSIGEIEGTPFKKVIGEIDETFARFDSEIIVYVAKGLNYVIYEKDLEKAIEIAKEDAMNYKMYIEIYRTKLRFGKMTEPKLVAVVYPNGKVEFY